MIEIEVYRNERWVPWSEEALSVGDRFRDLNGSNPEQVLRVVGGMGINEYGTPFIPVVAELH